MARPNYNRLRMLPFWERWAARKRLDRGEGLFGGGAVLTSTKDSGSGWSEVIKPSPHDALEKAIDFLGLTLDTLSEESIRKAVRTLSLEHHPDRGGDVAKFHQLIAARDRCLEHVKV